VTKLTRVIREELSSFHPRLQLALMATALVPAHAGRRVRAWLLRLGGLKIGRGTLFLGAPVMIGGGNPYRLLTIGEYCWVNMGVVFDLGAPVTIGNRVALGHEVLFITSSHDVGDRERRGGLPLNAPITVGDGVWIGARATLLPGVTVGEGAVVAAGAVVIRDVSPHTLVAGVPAKPARKLDSLSVHEARVIHQALEAVDEG
jgi:maltose O-acetyltransferase